MRKSLLKWLPALVILLLVGCWMFNEYVIRRPPGKVVVAEYEDYTILKRKDQYYLRLDDSKYVQKSSSGKPLLTYHPYSTPKFRSAQDMRDSILKGKLTEDELGFIWQELPWDGHGDYLIPDPYNITIPKDPYGTQLNCVCWHGDHLYFYYTNSLEQLVSINCYPLTKEHNVYSAFNEYLDRKEEYICKTEQTEDRNATVYYAQYEQREAKYIVYDLNAEGKQLRILEEYSSWDSEAPEYTEFCGIENGTYFSGRVTINRPVNYIKRLSVEFLQSLGIEPKPAH